MSKTKRKKKGPSSEPGPIPADLTQEEQDRRRARVLIMRGRRWLLALDKAHSLIAKLEKAIERSAHAPTTQAELLAMEDRINRAWLAWHLGRTEDSDALLDLATIVEAESIADYPAQHDEKQRPIESGALRAMVAQSRFTARHPAYAAGNARASATWRAAIERARGGKRDGGPGKWEAITDLAIELGVQPKGAQHTNVERQVKRLRKG